MIATVSLIVMLGTLVAVEYTVHGAWLRIAILGILMLCGLMLMSNVSLDVGAGLVRTNYSRHTANLLNSLCRAHEVESSDGFRTRLSTLRREVPLAMREETAFVSLFEQGG